VWARRTDKTIETVVPTTEQYLEQIEKCKEVNRVFIQTDDKEVAEQFSNVNDARFVVLPDLPLAYNNHIGFHSNMNAIPWRVFELEYKMSKVEYLQTFLALTYFAASCKYYIGYPGNLTTMVPLIRRSFDNCFLF